MDSPYTIEIEPEVRLWLMNLRDDDYLAVEYITDLLRGRPTTLGEPYPRHLGDGVRELRFSLGCNRDATRISYWLAPDRRIVLLTVFRKTRQRESAEVARQAHQGTLRGCARSRARRVHTQRRSR